MKGKYYFAVEHKVQEDYENIKSLSAYPIGRDGKVNTKTAYSIKKRNRKMDKIKMTDCQNNIWVVAAPKKLLPELRQIETDPKAWVNWCYFSQDSIYWDQNGNPYRVDIDRIERGIPVSMTGEHLEEY